MPVPCPEQAPTYYMNILHCIVVVSVPINILGLYLVLYKSPGLSKYKYCVFYVQAAAFLTEIQMSVVAPGYYFFPMIAGYHTNPFIPGYLNNPHILMTIWLFFFTSELPAIVSCFIYRHNAAENMVPNYENSRFVKKSVFVVSQLFPFAVGYFFSLSNLSKEQVFMFLSQNYPQCLFWMEHESFQLYDWNLNYWIAVTGLGSLAVLIVVPLYGFSLAIRTMLLLHKLRPHMSTQTYRIHRNALVALILQVILPSVLLFFPVFICFWVIAAEQLEYQALATNSTLLISFHSLCSTLVMIIANPRYRSIVCGYLCKLFRIAAPMSVPCPEQAPTYYMNILHCIVVVSVPINILGLYLVLYKSPGLSKYKYCVFYVQAAAFLTEIQMSVVAPGYYFFPMLAGYHTNQFIPSYLNNPHILMTIWLFFFTSEVPAILSCFIYRHNAAENMIPNHGNSRLVKKSMFVISQLFPFAVGYFFSISSLTNEQVFNFLSENYPQCLFWMEHESFQLYDWRLNYWVAVTGLGSLVVLIVVPLYAFSLGIRAMLLLHKLRSHMSVQTYRMHQSALIALILQVILPSVLLFLPVFICFWVIVTAQVEHQALATNSTLLISFHSLCTTLVMLIVNPRYRSIVCGCLSQIFRIKVQQKTIAPSTNFTRWIDS